MEAMNVLGSHWKVLSRGIAMIQARDSRGLNEIGSTSEQELETGYIVNVEIIAFAVGLEVKFGKKKGVKDELPRFLT